MFHKDKDTLNLLSSYAQRNEKKAEVKEKIIYRDMGKIHIKPSIKKEENKIFPKVIMYAISFFFIALTIREIYFMYLVNKVNNEMIKANNVIFEKTNEITKMFKKN